MIRVILAAALLQPAAAQTPPAWHLQLLHAVRPPEGTPGMFGNVHGLAVAADGSVYVAELNPARVSLYDRTGAFVRVVMKNGDGPGETRYPEIVLQGDTLIVYDPYSRTAIARRAERAPD